MGSHYIQVGKLKIDQELMNVICPAAGFTPELICTVENGYIPDPNVPYVPPVVIPDVATGEIVLLCDDTGYGTISLYATTSSGQVKIEVFTSTMFPIISTTFNSGSTYTYTFPTQGEGANYFIRLSPDTAGQNLTSFRVANTVGYPDEDSSVLVISINAPNLTSLANLVLNNQHIKTINYLCDLNSLTSLAGAYRNSSVKTINYPASMAALTTMDSAYRDLTYQPFQLDLSGVYLPLLSDLDYLCYQASVKSIKLPASLPAATTMAYLAYKTYLLESITMPAEEMPNLTNISYILAYSNVSEIQLPNVPAITNLSNAFAYMPNLRRLIFNGTNSNNNLTLTNWIASSPNIEELILPESMTGSNTFPTVALKKLTKYGNPIYVHPTSDAGLYSNLAYGNLTAELTRQVLLPTANLWVNFNSKKLTSFYHPGLRFSQLRIGNTGGIIPPLTTIELDWANSSCSGSTFLIYGQLPSEELNRIMTALPSVSGKNLDIRQNPGYETCDKTIATAKGWTVL